MNENRELVKRKGIMFRLHLDYLIRYFSMFLLCYGLHKQNVLFFGSPIGIFTETPYLLMSIFKLTLLTLLFNSVILNLFYNNTLMDEDNKWFVMIEHTISVFLAIYLSSIIVTNITVGNLITILLISAYLGFLNAKFLTKYFQIVYFIAFSLIIITAHLYSYGLHFKGWISAGIIIFTILISMNISRRLYSKLVSKQILKNPFKPGKINYMLLELLMSEIMNVVILICILFIFDKFNAIEISSYLKVLLLPIFYPILIFDLKYSWSRLHTEYVRHL